MGSNPTPRTNLPDDFKKEGFIGFNIKLLRNDLRHDLEHGEKKEIKERKMRLSKVYQHYTAKTTTSSLGAADSADFQVKILGELKMFLVDLKQHCIEQV